MNSIKILANGKYLPENRIDNNYLNNKFNLDEFWIEKRTGINLRHYAKHENITDLAIKSIKNMLEKINFDIEKVGMIVVATTSSNKLMPGVSFEIQKFFNIRKCMCLDILGGCSGYINAFDIVRKYITLGEVDYGLVVGAEILSEFINEDDVNTAILLGDGAGCTLIGKSLEEDKKYFQNIQSQGQKGEILTCSKEEKIYMDGKNIYKFATTYTIENIEQLLEISNEKIEDIKYIIPHQSNIRMLETICKRLNIDKSKMYINIENIGNTFCASIPIALSELYDKNLVKEKDKIILLGYGGGLNLGSILLEI